MNRAVVIRCSRCPYFFQIPGTGTSIPISTALDAMDHAHRRESPDCPNHAIKIVTEPYHLRLEP